MGWPVTGCCVRRSATNPQVVTAQRNPSASPALAAPPRLVTWRMHSKALFDGASKIVSSHRSLGKNPRRQGLTSPSYYVQAPCMTSNNILSRFSSARLKRAAAIRERIEKLEKELTGILGIPEAITLGGVVRRHRRLSRAARAKISAAAKARWAKVRAKRS